MNPVSEDIKDRINFFVKHREPFRPFCPSILSEHKKRYGIKKELPFMIVITEVPEESREDIKGIVHVDGTIRSQTVTKKQNPKFSNPLSS